MTFKDKASYGSSAPVAENVAGDPGKKGPTKESTPKDTDSERLSLQQRIYIHTHITHTYT